MRSSVSTLFRFKKSLVGVLALAAATTVLAGREDDTASSKATLADLAWFAGHWRSDSGGKIVEEVWLPSRGGTMIGMNRTTAGKGGEFEFLRIDETDGKVAYLASPGGRFPPTSFALKSIKGQMVEFENPNHDFPKRIRYERKGETLVATIYGDGDESMSWSWKRANKID